MVPSGTLKGEGTYHTSVWQKDRQVQPSKTEPLSKGTFPGRNPRKGMMSWKPETPSSSFGKKRREERNPLEVSDPKGLRPRTKEQRRRMPGKQPKFPKTFFGRSREVKDGFHPIGKGRQPSPDGGRSGTNRTGTLDALGPHP